MKPQSDRSLAVPLIICITLVLLAAIGAWVFVQKQQLAQREIETQLKLEADSKEQEESLKRL